MPSHGLSRRRLSSAQQALEDAVVRAPFNGVITARLVVEGVYLNKRFSIGGQSAAIEVQQFGVVAAIVNAPQEYVDEFRKNLPAKVFVEGFNEPFDSMVYIINDRVDPEARTVELRLPIRNPDYRISSGLSARAEIAIPPTEAVVLPRSAVLADGGTAYVFVVSREKAMRRPVEVESIDLDRMRVIEGLEPGEIVVRAPRPTLRDGDAVSVRQQAANNTREGANVAR
ncbi:MULTISPECIES: efflux RND transporter periplasmic adaptor subunit [Pacificimonas]|uniref:efflux RND transporter periplasmic adaptor subunit n=1 Tax=Pacificimonas TaxID=1960290 RepID=UPI001CCFF10C|nr:MULTISPECIES: efflux RND transporter periplasmic adaptor subunit [Pacificimonas]